MEATLTRPDMRPAWQAIRRNLREVARPDSRFDTDLDQFIPAFEGIAAASARAIADPGFEAAKLLFVTPDNSMQPLRREALARGKTLLVPSYGLRRGFSRIGPETVPPELALFASWGDGIQYFSEPLPLERLASAGSIDLVLAGAAAVAWNGLRFGMGYGYLDVEWNMFHVAGAVGEETPIWTMVHDCQVLEEDIPGESDSVLVDKIFTPTRTIEVGYTARPNEVTRRTLNNLFGPQGCDPQLLQHIHVEH